MKQPPASNGNVALLWKVYGNPRYRGKWLILVHGRAFAHRGGVAGVRMLRSLLKRYPRETPTIVYVPKVETLILLL